MPLDIATVILSAKLGRARKDAQIDCCEAFAAALYDVLRARGISCTLQTAAFRFKALSQPEWYHAVVKVEGRHYDSLGEFSLDIHRTRTKIHASVKAVIDYKRARRRDGFEADFAEMHQFYVKALGASCDAALRLETAREQTAPASSAAAPEQKMPVFDMTPSLF